MATRNNFFQKLTQRVFPDKPENKNDEFFFRSIKRYSLLLFLATLVAITLIYAETGNAYNAIAIMLTVVWVIIFLRYFLWAIYHYNINYGITDKDWEIFEDAKERQTKGEAVHESELNVPDKNPYRSQTFGLPPGTVRGMIALTLLFGALTLLIVSMGLSKEQLENSLIRDQFEFFKTAFLMMIAFYFGDKSLKVLQKRWKNPNSTLPQPGENTNNNGGNQSTPGNSDLDLDDEEFEATEGKQPSKTKVQIIKDHLNQAATIATKNDELKKDYGQIDDQTHQKILNDDDQYKIIHRLENTDGIVLQPAVLKAIIDVESRGRGHLPDGRAKILFEGHKFWYWLKQFDIKPEDHLEGNEDILYPKWTKQYYVGGAGEYARFNRAKKIHETAAIYSASWGLFQIMGENLTSFIKSRVNASNTIVDNELYIDVNDFETKQDESEFYHLLDFIAFIKTKKIKGKRLIDYIAGNDATKFDWANFAYGYNGSGYQQNKYDIKLQKAYDKNSVSNENVTAIKLKIPKRIPIIDAGHGGIDLLGNYSTGKKKRYKFIGLNQEKLEILEGVINRQIASRLIEKLKKAKIDFYNLNADDINDMPLGERVQEANNLYKENRGYYFLSLHSNTAGNDATGTGKKATGFEIYTSPGQTKSDELAELFAVQYKSDFPDINFRADKTDDDLDKESNFTVLTQTICPALLVENLFYDNFEEAKFLISEAGQELIADCLFKAVKKINDTIPV